MSFRSFQSYRIPDLAFFTFEQIGTSTREENPVPGFVIEIISPNDVRRHIQKKLAEYFRAGVVVVWHIEPAFEIVRVCRSLTDIESYQGPARCSGGPAFSEFSMTVDQILA